MKILILSQYFWPEAFRINDVAESLVDAGDDVTVLTGHPNYPDGKVFAGYRSISVVVEERQGIRVFRVPIVPRGRATALLLMLNYLSFIVSASILGSWLLRGRRFDVVLVYAPSPILQAIPGILLARLKGAKVVTWVQDLWPESLRATGFVRRQRILNVLGGLVRWIYSHNDLLLVPSRAFVDSVRLMAKTTTVEYCPNPGEIVLSGETVDCSSPLKLTPGFNIVFAGNLGKVQALDTLLAAAESLRDLSDVRFVLVGSGSQSEWLEEERKRRNLENVHLTGRFPPVAMPGIFNQASALLVSLVRDPIMARTIPSKVQAYLAAGRPIVAALDGEGARVVREAGAGFDCSAEDAHALADVILRLRSLSPEERGRMGAAGRAYYEKHFEPGAVARELSQRLSRLMINDRGGSLATAEPEVDRRDERA